MAKPLMAFVKAWALAIIKMGVNTQATGRITNNQGRVISTGRAVHPIRVGS